MTKNDYQTKTLGDIVGVTNGTWGPADNLGTAVLRSTNFTNDGYISFDDTAYREIPTKKVTELALQSGDILLEKSGGSPAQPVGRVAFFDKKPDKEIVFGNFISRLKPSGVNSKYLFYYLLSLYKNGVTNRLQSQTTGIRNLILTKYLELKIHLPSDTVQQQITDKLDSIRKFQELNQKEIEKSEELFNALITESFRPRNEWQAKKLPDVAVVKRGKFTPRPRNDPKYFGGSIPWIQTGDITNSNGLITSYSQTLNEEGLAVSRLFPKGTIVVTIAANIGDFAVLGIDAAFPDSVVGITADEKIVIPKFLYYQLLQTKSYLDSQATQAAQKNINLQVLSTVNIYVLPVEAQLEIVKRLGETKALQETLLLEKTKLTELFESTLNKTMRVELIS